MSFQRTLKANVKLVNSVTLFSSKHQAYAKCNICSLPNFLKIVVYFISVLITMNYHGLFFFFHLLLPDTCIF